MATSTLPKGALWMQNVNYPAQWDRALIDVVWQSEGFLSGFVVAPAGGLNISVAAGQAVVTGDEVAGQGKYLVDSDSSVNLLLAAVGVTRTEYVWVQIDDAAVAGGRAGNNVKIVTGAAVPANSALLIATLQLPAGTATITAGMITDNRTMVGVTPADGAVTTGKIADGAVTSAKIADATIATGDLADGAVTSAKIADATIATGDLANLAVTSGKLADGAVTAAKIGSQAVRSTAFSPSVFQRGAPQSLPPTAATLINWNTEVIDLDGWGTVSTTTFTCPATGVYAISYEIDWAANPAITSAHNIKVNGTAVIGAVETSPSGFIYVASHIFHLTAGDVLSFEGTNNTGSSINVTAKLFILRLY